MSTGLTRAILAAAGYVILVIAAGLISGPAWGLALSSTGLLGLFICRFGRDREEYKPALHSNGDPVPASESSLNHAAQSCGASVLDREFRVLWSNAVSGMHLGIRAESDIGRPLGLILRGSSLPAYLAAGDFSRPLKLRLTGQEARVLSVWLVPYVDARWLLLSLDVTHAIERDIARRNCVADALHELSSPITVLAGNIDAMRGPAPGSRRLRDGLDSMEQQCWRLRRIVESLLSLAALESAPKPAADERIGLRALCATIRAETQALSAGRHRVVLDSGPDLDLFGCRDEIASAFGNLASNAVRYTPAGGEIRLAWRAMPGGGLEFSVTDNGVGIAREYIPRLTERFFRVDRELSRKSAGTGLGLAIVKDVLTRHQATLHIESELGKGSLFAARFPARRVIRVTAQIPSAEVNAIVVQPSPISLKKIPSMTASGRIPVPELRSAPSRAYGRVIAIGAGRTRRSRKGQEARVPAT